MSLTAGSRLGVYEVVAALGAGGFSNSPNYEVSREGRILAVVDAEASRDKPLTVVVNWKAARP